MIMSGAAEGAGGARRKMHRLCCVALAVALSAAACGGSDTTQSTEPSSAPSTTQTETIAPSTTIAQDEAEATAEPVAESDTDIPAPGLEFTSCGEGAECGSIEVPLDYDTPEGATTTVHVTRHPASAERLGTLFVNPGGPGLSGEEMVKGLAGFGPPPISAHFDIVGLDPRGTGKSVPIDCNDNWEEDAAWYPTPVNGFEDDVEHLLRDFEALANACEAEYGVEYLASITTENAARDIETVRVALGDEPISYLGHSYGTAIGSVYATLFPDSVRSMILAGAVPVAPLQSRLMERGENLERALLEHDRSCELWSACPVGDVGFLNAIEAVRAELQEGDIGPLTPMAFERVVGVSVGVRPVMPALAEGLELAMNGNGNMLTVISRDFLTRVDGGGVEHLSGRFEAIVCADGWALAAGDSDSILPDLERTSTAFPNLGAGHNPPCDLWPVRGDGIPPIEYRGEAPILVVGNRGDAITPYAWSEELTTALGSHATLLTWEGSGHAALFQGASGCLDEAALAFLLADQVPEDDTTCFVRGLIGFHSSGNGDVVVTSVTPGSAAEDAGLRIGDKILSEDGRTIGSPEDFAIAGIGEPAQLEIERDGEILTIDVVRRPPIWDLWMTEPVG